MNKERKYKKYEVIMSKEKLENLNQPNEIWEKKEQLHHPNEVWEKKEQLHQPNERWEKQVFWEALGKLEDALDDLDCINHSLESDLVNNSLLDDFNEINRNLTTQITFLNALYDKLEVKKWKT